MKLCFPLYQEEKGIQHLKPQRLLFHQKTKQKKVIATGNNLNNTTHAEEDSLDKTSKTYPSENSSVSVKGVVPSDTSSVSIKEEKRMLLSHLTKKQ